MPSSKSGVKKSGPSKEQVIQALAAIKEGVSQRKASNDFNVLRATIQRLLKRDENKVRNYEPYKKCAVKQVFSAEETSLVNYLFMWSKFTTAYTKISSVLAYSFVTKIIRKFPSRG